MKGKIIINEEELKKKLTKQQYQILREKGTEKPFSSPLLTNHENGEMLCRVCKNPLFSSTARFESNTGWPSFDQALPGAVLLQTDDSHGSRRIEVACAKCGSHLGHVFNDGPRKTTGQRYCINGTCLLLKKDKKPEKTTNIDKI